ncbi:MAG: DNA polymerase III subunit alpha [Porticoccaceae bacterium]|nr:DNA polymerase III subunit alpha [Porticoccaceae bacterium]MBT7376149.1 DNA polymerase III subunit alpha [Porticoccaceae bacterium]
MTKEFVHLRLHSEYSLVDGLVRIKPLAKKVAEELMPAVALTDFNNFFGLVKFYKAAQAVGVKPIVGADLLVLEESGEGNPTQLVLLVADLQGYQNLTKLVSMAYQAGQRQGVPYIRKSWLAAHADGLIALSGGRLGEIGVALISGRRADAEQLLREFMQLFPDRFYLELQRTGRAGEEDYLHAAVDLASQYSCPVVATNDVRFLSTDEFEAHEARVCIHEGRALDDPRRERRYSEHQYLRTAAEMAELFSDIPEALQNSVEIAKRCNLDLRLGEYFLPDYPIPDGLTINEFFIKVSEEGLEARLAKLFDTEAEGFAETRAVYLERLKFELDIIIQMGFPGYFLIVMDFIGWAKDNQIPVGPGRGSGAGSLVAYALKITDLDPIEYDLLFERFLNPERVSMPDFDIDFCMEGRDRVIAYVSEQYGRDAVSQIVTFGTMAAKAVVRDVARVQGKSYGLADKLSKLIPFEVGMTLEKAVEQEEELAEFLEQDEEAGEIWSMALQLEGVSRNCGKHAGGVVIAPTVITDFSPIYCDDTGGGVVTQFDKNDVEEAGLVKFDFLGLRTLTIIDWAVRMINRTRSANGEEALDIEKIPLDDVSTYELMQRAETTAVFQLESRGMKELIKKLGPDRFEDIVALVALFRPGPLQSGMVDDFINRKKGRAEVSYPHIQYQHDCLKPALEPTYGIILYQEQVMQIAQEMGGYTLGGADLLRRAMGKKNAAEMAKQRELFTQGAVAKGFAEDLASNIFDLMEKFAGYGFNKSHSAAYALVAYQTGWLKAHYPAEFMAATISSDMDKTDKVVTFIDECRAMSLDLLPPDVNQGQFHFSVDPQGRVIYGLGAIKGLGEGPVENIIAARSDGGPFKDLFDFCARVDGRKVNKRALEAMIRSGALDEIGPDGEIGYRRAVMLAALDEAVKLAEQQARNASSGMGDLFGESIAESASEINYSSYNGARALSVRDRLNGEKETLGLYLTGHPIDEYEEELRTMVPGRIADLRPGKDSSTVAGMVVGMRIMKNKRGDSFAFLTLDDKSGRIELSVWADKFNAYRDILSKDALLVIQGAVSEDSFTGGLKLVAESIQSIYEARCSKLNRLHLSVTKSEDTTGWVDRFHHILSDFKEGNCPVTVEYEIPSAAGELTLSRQWLVQPRDELITRLREDFGKNSVTLHYH